MSKLTPDLHPVYNKNRDINKSLVNLISRAEEKGVGEAEIIYGKGSGQLKKRVLKFLDQKEIREKYRRIKKDPNNSGRVFLYF